MNNKILIIFVLIITVFLVCGATGCKKLPWQTAKEVISGRGVSAQFRTGEPPLDGIYASNDENFIVALDIANHMQTPTKVRACISDTPSSVFGGIPSACEIAADPDPVPAAEKIDSKFYPGKAVMESGPFYYDVNKVEKGMTTNIIVDLKVDYNLRLTPQICIKKPDAEIADVYCEDVSTLSGNTLGEDAQTAPITVTKIEKQIWPIGGNAFNIHLRIYLDNLGEGKLYKDGKIDPRQVLKTPTVNLIGGGKFTCMPNKIYLEKGVEKIITCDLKVTLDEDEVVRRNPLVIEFGYTYGILASTGEIPIIVPKGRETTSAPVEWSEPYPESEGWA